MEAWDGGTELTLGDVQREFPAWECWRGVSGLYHARPAKHPEEWVTGEDAVDLRDVIVRELWLEEARAG
jgi:hypothetical protein